MNKFKAIRKKYRVKQVELSKSSGISSQYLSRLENDWSPLTPKVLTRIVKGYKDLGFNVLKDVIGTIPEEKHNES